MNSPAPFDLSNILLKEYFFIEFAILNNAPELIQSPVPMIATRFERTMATGFDLEESLIQIELKLVITPRGADKELLPIQGKFHLVLQFTVLGLADQLETDPITGRLHPNRELIYTVASLAYSTARGILAERVRDTPLSYFSLPAVDVRSLAWNSGSPPSNAMPSG